MDFNDRDIKRLSVIFLVLVLGVLVFFLIKPVIISLISGLLLAYIFFPVHKFISKYIRERNTSASLVSVIVILIIVVPIWFVTPLMIKQIFELFSLSQGIEFGRIFQAILPTASQEFVNQLSITISGAISKTGSSILSSLSNQLLNAHTIILNFFIVGFVFFFTLRDWDFLKEFVGGISPLNKSQETVLVKHFRDITDSIIYGHVIVGLLQGILAGIGFLLFGVPNALVLTVLAIILGILPILGPPIIYIPLSIYFYTQGNIPIAIGFLIYNLIMVSGIEYFMRIYIVSRRSDLPTVLILIGMIGGFFIFGFLGFILGPLILAYFLVLLKAYKEKALSALFAD